MCLESCYTCGLYVCADALQKDECCCVAIGFLYARKQLLKKVGSILGQDKGAC